LKNTNTVHSTYKHIRYKQSPLICVSCVKSYLNASHCTSTSRLTDIGACLDCQQGGLLQFTSHRNVRATSYRLQSVLTATARLIFTARRTDQISPLLRDLHWLRVPECVKFKLCVLAYRCLQGTASPYLIDDLSLGSADGNRCHLQSADSPTLVVKPTRCSTLGNRMFPMAAACAWNSLPAAVRDAPSLLLFRSRLKTWFFELSL